MSVSLLVTARINGSIRRRLFQDSSSRCSFCSAGGRNKKRRRGKPSLAPTKKDRIRALDKKPEPTFEMPSIDIQTVGDTLESRLTQAQDFVYKFWRGEQQQARPERATLNMDSRWWFWNLLLMSMPGIMIAVYCEFKAKPEMHELLGKLDKEQRQRILGGTLEAEKEVFEMGESDVQRLQESVNEEIMESDADENLTLLALKHRLDALEAQLSKKDQQLNHLRRYQLERTQQSGVQNRIEDKMISEWKSQSNQAQTPAQGDDSAVEADDSLSERMKEAVLHGFGENLEAKKAVLKKYGEQGLAYGRRLVYGEDEPAPLSDGEGPAPTTSPDGASIVASKNDSHDQVIKAVSETAVHASRAAEVVSSSVSSSSDPEELSRAATEASEAATKASRAAAEATAASAASQSQPRFIVRQWNKWFRRKNGPQEESEEDS